MRKKLLLLSIAAVLSAGSGWAMEEEKLPAPVNMGFKLPLPESYKEDKESAVLYDMLIHGVVTPDSIAKNVVDTLSGILTGVSEEEGKKIINDLLSKDGSYGSGTISTTVEDSSVNGGFKSVLQKNMLFIFDKSKQKAIDPISGIIYEVDTSLDTYKDFIDGVDKAIRGQLSKMFQFKIDQNMSIYVNDDAISRKTLRPLDDDNENIKIEEGTNDIVFSFEGGDSKIYNNEKVERISKAIKLAQKSEFTNNFGKFYVEEIAAANSFGGIIENLKTENTEERMKAIMAFDQQYQNLTKKSVKEKFEKFITVANSDLFGASKEDIDNAVQKERKERETEIQNLKQKHLEEINELKEVSSNTLEEQNKKADELKNGLQSEINTLKEEKKVLNKQIYNNNSKIKNLNETITNLGTWFAAYKKLSESVVDMDTEEKLENLKNTLLDQNTDLKSKCKKFSSSNHGGDGGPKPDNFEGIKTQFATKATAGSLSATNAANLLELIMPANRGLSEEEATELLTIVETKVSNDIVKEALRKSIAAKTKKKNP